MRNITRILVLGKQGEMRNNADVAKGAGHGTMMPSVFNPFDDQRDRIGGKVATVYALLIFFNVAAWIWAWVAFAGQPALLGTAFLAYMFGLRHAFDADHIAAIDNVVRKLRQDDKAPVTVGFFFSLGHSSVVVLASVAIAAATLAMRDNLAVWRVTGSVIGTGVSALFLLIIGLANLLILPGIWRTFVRARRGAPIGEADLDRLLTGSGVLTRLFRPLFGGVTRSWHLYPIGFLFGLGFDTATEIGVLGIAAQQAAHGIGFWTILIFPALFTAGMSLMDTTDSMLMTGAYGWAFVKPIRKLWYNLTITGASVAVALFIGGVEALGLLGDKLMLDGPFWSTISHLNHDLTDFGGVVVLIFLGSWAVSALTYKVMRTERLVIGPQADSV